MDESASNNQTVKGLSIKGKYQAYWNGKPFMAFGADDGWKPFVTFNGAGTVNFYYVGVAIMALLIAIMF